MFDECATVSGALVWSGRDAPFYTPRSARCHCSCVCARAWPCVCVRVIPRLNEEMRSNLSGKTVEQLEGFFFPSSTSIEYLLIIKIQHPPFPSSA